MNDISASDDENVSPEEDANRDLNPFPSSIDRLQERSIVSETTLD